MTITYCDFCGEKIDRPDEDGDTVQIGDPISSPEGRLNACAECSRILWYHIRLRDFRSLAPVSLPPVAAQQKALTGTVNSTSPDSEKEKGGAK